MVDSTCPKVNSAPGVVLDISIINERRMNSHIVSRWIRSDNVESVHQVSAVLIDPAGEVVFSAGDINASTYIRSAAKPFQALALLESGAYAKFGVTVEELAVVCASHSSQPRHLDVVRGFQQKVGVTDDDLHCGPHPPYNREAEEDVLRSGELLTALYNNCSGKHTGFLAAAKAMHASLDSYLDPEHPVQLFILEQIQEMLRLDEITLGIDGCSAPTYYLSLQNMARMIQQLADRDNDRLSRQFHAMSTNPFLVGGSKRFDTDFMKVMGGRAVAKEGAEGLQTIAIRDEKGQPYGLVVKVLDGNSRPRPQAVMGILHRFGLIDDLHLNQLNPHLKPIFKNWAGHLEGILETELPGSNL